MKEIRIKQVQMETGKIMVYLYGITQQKDFILLDEKTGNQMQVEKVEEENNLLKISFAVRPSVESLGNFSLFLKQDDGIEQILAEESCYEKLSLDDYKYDQESDLYIRCLKNQEGNLTFAISRARKIGNKKVAQIREIESSLNRLDLHFEDDVIGTDADYRFFVVPAKLEGMWVQPSEYDNKKKHLTIDMHCFGDVVKAKATPSGKWRMYLETLHKGEYRIFRIGCESQMKEIRKGSEDFYDYRSICREALCSYMEEDRNYEAYPYFTENGNVALLKNPKDRKYSFSVMNKVLDLRIHNGILKLSIQAHKTDMQITGILLSLRTKKLDEKQSYRFRLK